MPKSHKVNTERVIEAALFSAGRPISLEEITDATGLSTKEVTTHLPSLINYYKDLGAQEETSLEIGKAGDKYVMQLRATYAHYGKKLAPMEVPEKLWGTLALIAYHQPIRQSQVREMIGQKVSDHVGELVELGLVTTRKDGRSCLLATSASFPEYFGLSTSDREEIRGFLLGKVKQTGENMREDTGKKEGV